MLTVEEIHTFFGKSYILQGVSVEVGEGKIIAVLGRNGVGKTTLIRSIMGLIPTSKGRVLLRGEDITGLPSYARAKRGVGLVPQGRQIFPSLTVLENLRINARPPIQADGPRWDLDSIFGQFPILKHRMSNRGDQLSGGEQQMLAICRALLGNPIVLLMDEPSEGLAPLIVQEIASMIEDFRASGLSVLLVEQNFNFAMNAADYVYLMNKGRIVYESSPAELAENREVRARFLGI
jgi:branched-chain amino acid transport system ATP-binding protein